MEEKEKIEQPKSTTILLDADQRELVMRTKSAMEEKVKKSSGVEIRIPMREVVIMCVKDKLTEMLSNKDSK